MNTCKVCGNEIPDDRIVCSKKCAGRLGTRPRKPLQEKVAEIGTHGYLYYTHVMLTPEERKRNPGRLILLHRFAMAEYLGRKLEPGEVVMHINGNKLDNRIENLQLGNSFLNTRQHYDALIEAAQWKGIAVCLLALIK